MEDGASIGHDAPATPDIAARRINQHLAGPDFPAGNAHILQEKKIVSNPMSGFFH
jgi:hypothetical protein